MKATQDHYPVEFAHCYGCGPANPHGHHLKIYLDGDRTVATRIADGLPWHRVGSGIRLSGARAPNG
ncbi:hypothetical protein [Burkholderia pseudomallei]